MENRNNRKMHILCITRAYGQHAGGMERLSYEFIAALSQSPQCAVTVIAHQGSRRTAPFFIIPALLRALYQARTVDIVHLGDPLLSVIGWVIKKIYKKPVAVTVHGLDITYPHPLYQRYLRLFFPALDLYLPISASVATLLASFKPARIKTITPGIHDNYYDATLTREQLATVIPHLGSDTTVLLTVGRVIPRKGQHWFVEHVLPYLPKNTVYCIAGTGPDRDAIRQTAARLHLHKQVILLDRVNKQTLRMMYNTADAFVQPNIPVKHDVEGFGLVLLEAALCERPVFAADIDGVPSAIHHERNGILVPAQNKDAWVNILHHAFKNKEQYITLGKQARTYTLENFSWIKKTEEYLQAFSEIR